MDIDCIENFGVSRLKSGRVFLKRHHRRIEILCEDVALFYRVVDGLQTHSLGGLLVAQSPNLDCAHQAFGDEQGYVVFETLVERSAFDGLEKRLQTLHMAEMLIGHGVKQVMEVSMADLRHLQWIEGGWIRRREYDNVVVGAVVAGVGLIGVAHEVEEDREGAPEITSRLQP